MIISGVVASASRPAPIVVTGAASSNTPAPTVVTNAASNFNQNSGTMNGSTSSGTLSYLWGTTSNPTTATSSASLTGLPTDTTHYFRAVGTTTTATALLTGTVTSTTFTTVVFQWGTSSGVYPNTVSAGTVNEAVSQSVSASITGLTPGTTYYYRIRATTPTGFVYGSQQTHVAQNATAQGSVLSFKTYRFLFEFLTATPAGSIWTPPATSGAPINTIYNVVLIGGGGRSTPTSGDNTNLGGGGSGQGRLINSISFSNNSPITVIVGGGGQSTTVHTETANAGQEGPPQGILENQNGGTSGDGWSGGTYANYIDFFGGTSGQNAAATGGGGGASGAGTNAYLTGGFPYGAVGGNGGPARTLTWTGIDGTAREWAYGGGGAGKYLYGSSGSNGVRGGYGADATHSPETGRGGGGWNGGAGGTGFVFFEYWGP